MAKTQKSGTIELLRFIFAACIVILHSKTFHPKGFLFPRASLGVEFFFIVSGYLMANSICKLPPLKEGELGKETRRFLMKKIRSILPEYLIAFCIALLVVQAYAGDYSLFGLLKKLANCIWEPLFLSMSGFGRVRVNGVDWYISAMLLSMLILYPLYRRFFELSVHVIAPAAAIFLLGYIYWKTGTTLEVSDNMGIAYKGMLRGVAEISLGVACFPAVRQLQQMRLKSVARWCISALEITLYGMTVAYMAFGGDKTYDFLAVLFVCAAVCLSFSHQGMLAGAFDNKVCYFLGKFSLSLYLSHVYWGRALGVWYPDGEYGRLLGIYAGLTLGTAVFVFVTANIFRKHGRKLSLYWKKMIME